MRTITKKNKVYFCFSNQVKPYGFGFKLSNEIKERKIILFKKLITSLYWLKLDCGQNSCKKQKLKVSQSQNPINRAIGEIGISVNDSS